MNRTADQTVLPNIFSIDRTGILTRLRLDSSILPLFNRLRAQTDKRTRNESGLCLCRGELPCTHPTVGVSADPTVFRLAFGRRIRDGVSSAKRSSVDMAKAHI
jgi:hypothetical protein